MFEDGLLKSPRGGADGWSVFSTGVLLVAACSLSMCWVTIASWLLGARYIHDRSLLRRDSDVEGLSSGNLAVRDLTMRRLRPVALGMSSPGATTAARALVCLQQSALLRRAAGSRRKGARLRALTILVRAESPSAVGLLRAAITESPTLAASALRLASELGTRAADMLLLDVLIEGKHPRSRTATELEPRATSIRGELLELASHPEAGLRFWAVTLLSSGAGDSSTASAVAWRASDVDPTVRAAAAEALGKVESGLSRPILRRLLEDDAFFVRAHAARGVGEGRMTDLAVDVLPLLADTNWWVRAAAKESLLSLGADGFRAAVAALGHDDSFARDGALEIVVASGHLHDVLSAAEQGDPEARALAAMIEERRAWMFQSEQAVDPPATLGQPAKVAA